jgi:hypothetical protein
MCFDECRVNRSFRGNLRFTDYVRSFDCVVRDPRDEKQIKSPIQASTNI